MKIQAYFDKAEHVPSVVRLVYRSVYGTENPQKLRIARLSQTTPPFWDKPKSVIMEGSDFCQDIPSPQELNGQFKARLLAMNLVDLLTVRLSNRRAVYSSYEGIKGRASQ